MSDNKSDSNASVSIKPILKRVDEATGEVTRDDLKNLRFNLVKCQIFSYALHAKQSFNDVRRLPSISQSIDEAKDKMVSKLEELNPATLERFIKIQMKERQLYVDNAFDFFENNSIYLDLLKNDPIYLDLLKEMFNDPILEDYENPFSNKAVEEKIKQELIARAELAKSENKDKEDDE